jgi:hypothetical protein
MSLDYEVSTSNDLYIERLYLNRIYVHIFGEKYTAINKGPETDLYVFKPENLELNMKCEV